MRTLVVSLLAGRIPFVHFDANGVTLTISPEARLLLGNAYDHALDTLADMARVVGRSDGESNGPRDFQLRAGALTLNAGAVALLGPANRLEVLMVLSIAPTMTSTPHTEVALLTPRERQVAEYVASGLPSAAIARVLGISVHTVRRHTERVFSKTGVRSRSQLVRLVLNSEASETPLKRQ